MLQPDTHKKLTFYPAFMLVLAFFFIVYDYLIQVAPSVVANTLMHDFHLNATGLGWLTAAFLLAYAGMQIPAGRLLDRFGVRRMTSLAVLVSGLGVFLFAHSHTLASAVITRLLVGGGSAFSFLGGLYIVQHAINKRHYALAVGCIQIGCGVGGIFGEAPLVYLINAGGWRLAFIHLAWVAVTLAFAFILFLRDKPQSQPLKSTPFHFGLLIRNKMAWLIISLNFLSWLPASAVAGLWGIPFLMQAKHLNNELAARVFIVYWLVLSFGAPCVGWLADRSKQPLSLLATAFTLALVGAIILLFAGHLSFNTTRIALVLLALPASSQCIVFMLIKQQVPSHYAVTAGSLANMASIVGGAFGQLVCAGLLQWHSHGAYTTHDYQRALLFIPVCMLAGILISLSLKRSLRLATNSFTQS